MSYSEYVALRDTTRSLRQLAAYLTFGAQVEEDPSVTFGMMVSCNFFAVDGLDRAIMGRLFVPDDCHAPGQAAVALISEDLWQSRFAADPRMIGRVIRVKWPACHRDRRGTQGDVRLEPPIAHLAALHRAHLLLPQPQLLRGG